MSANFNNARKGPRDFGGKQGGGFNKNGPAGKFNKFDKKKQQEEEVVPEKVLSRREQKLHAELAASMANEQAAMQSEKAEKAEKKADNKKPANRTDAKKPVHPMVAAFGNASNNADNYGKNPVDFCGKGHPFDRLQFGYSPSENDEARAYHSQFSAKDWIKARTANYKTAIIKRQRLPKLNCEPLTTMYKLKRYWASISNSANDVGGNIFDGAFAEDLLDQLASRQLRADETTLAQQ